MFVYFLVIISVLFHIHFLKHHENRYDLVSVIDSFTPFHHQVKDMSNCILFSEYSCVLLTCMTCLLTKFDPWWFDLNLYGWYFCYFFTGRTFFIHLLPLYEPRGAIPIQDPFQLMIESITFRIMKWFSFSDHGFPVPPTKMFRHDLMISGHTGIVAMMFLCTQSIWLQIIFLMGSLGVAYGMWRSRIHYTIDIVMVYFYLSGLYLFLPSTLNMFVIGSIILSLGLCFCWILQFYKICSSSPVKIIPSKE